MKKAHNCVWVVEGSHAFVRTVRKKLYVDLPATSIEERLPLKLRSLKDTLNSDSRTRQMALVYGFFQKIPGGEAQSLMFKRSELIRACTEAVIQVKARRTVAVSA